MKNFGQSFKKFISNKNTVTILGVILGVIVLWYFYQKQVNTAINPITVPYAKVEIGATEEITEDKIGYVEVNSKLLKTSNILTTKSAVVGKYVTTGTSIPAGGLFVSSQVVTKDAIPNTILENIPKGYTLFSLAVNNHTTFANSIYPGDRIDLYIKTTDSNRTVYGKLIESIEVLAVRDSSGKNVFATTDSKTPSELLFAVPDEMYLLLMKAQYANMTIVPVPRNKNYTEEAGETQYSSDYLKNIILSTAATIPDETITTTE